MTRAILLCAGFGTRLGELTSDRPKPMLPVCDRSIVRYGVALLVGHGVRDIVVNTHHGADSLRRELGDGAAFGARIQYSDEEVLLGTGGGIKKALGLLDPDDTDEPILALNGKLIFDLDLHGLVEAFKADPEAIGMLVVRRVPNPLDWGAVQVSANDNGRLRIRDVLSEEGQHMFCGVHVTRPSVMARLPDGESCSIRQGYLPWLRTGQQVAAYEAPSDAYFAEHSTPARYLASNRALLSGASLRFPPGKLREIDPSAHVHPTAVLRHPVRIGAGAHIGENTHIGSHTVIGSHAIVEDDASIRRSVVWPGSRARGIIADAIVTPQGTYKPQ